MSNFARLAVSMSGSLHDIGLPSIHVTHSVLIFQNVFACKNGIWTNFMDFLLKR